MENVKLQLSEVQAESEVSHERSQDLEEEIQTLEANAKDLSREISELLKAADQAADVKLELSRQVTEAEAAVTVAVAASDEMKGSLQAAVARIEVLESDLSNACTSLTEASTRVSQLEASHRDMEADLEEARLVIASLEGECEAKDSELLFSEQSLAEVQKYFEGQLTVISAGSSSPLKQQEQALGEQSPLVALDAVYSDHTLIEGDNEMTSRVESEEIVESRPSLEEVELLLASANESILKYEQELAMRDVELERKQEQLVATEEELSVAEQALEDIENRFEDIREVMVSTEESSAAELEEMDLIIQQKDQQVHFQRLFSFFLIFLLIYYSISDSRSSCSASRFAGFFCRTKNSH